MNSDARVEALEVENERLRDQIEQLERMLGMDADAIRFPIEWRLTGHEAQLLGFMATREVASKEAMMMALYSTRIDEQPEIKIVDVYVCKIRKKLKPFGIEIGTQWGAGYFLDVANKARIQAATGRQEAA